MPYRHHIHLIVANILPPNGEALEDEGNVLYLYCGGGYVKTNETLKGRTLLVINCTSMKRLFLRCCAILILFILF